MSRLFALIVVVGVGVFSVSAGDVRIHYTSVPFSQLHKLHERYFSGLRLQLQLFLGVAWGSGWLTTLWWLSVGAWCQFQPPKHPPGGHHGCEKEVKEGKKCEAEVAAQEKQLEKKTAEMEAEMDKLRKEIKQLQGRKRRALKSRQEMAAHILAACKYIRQSRWFKRNDDDGNNSDPDEPGVDDGEMGVDYRGIPHSKGIVI